MDARSYGHRLRLFHSRHPADRGAGIFFAWSARGICAGFKPSRGGGARRVASESSGKRSGAILRGLGAATCRSLSRRRPRTLLSRAAGRSTAPSPVIPISSPAARSSRERTTCFFCTSGATSSRNSASAPKLVVIGERGWENEHVIDLLERSRSLQGHVIGPRACRRRASGACFSAPGRCSCPRSPKDTGCP